MTIRTDSETFDAERILQAGQRDGQGGDTERDRTGDRPEARRPQSRVDTAEPEGEHGRHDDATDGREGDQTCQVPAVASREDLPERDDRHDTAEHERERETADADAGGVALGQRDDVLDRHLLTSCLPDRLRGTGEAPADRRRACAGNQGVDTRLVDHETADHLTVLDRVSQPGLRVVALWLVRVGSRRGQASLERTDRGRRTDHTDPQIVGTALQRRQDEDHQQEDEDDA
ncbi:hypothetical protein QEN35_22590 [Gordonia alkanivorans]|uniref:hypothetical protein n=1 Tax=Gordonia alkanivorans TaxID=84096 RepID=UPI001F4E0576|nr:hypothetical protein [Gordonia alkanivorans]MDH3027140.1 hypothetical protein [Gordonia alkanivorans]MDH3052169.1 hypothetical protein [Gordonia alkanivorans]